MDRIALFLLSLLVTTACQKSNNPSSKASSSVALSRAYDTEQISVCWADSNANLQVWRERAKALAQSEFGEKTTVSFVGWKSCDEDPKAHIKLALTERYRPVSCVGPKDCELKQKLGATMVLSPGQYSLFDRCHGDFKPWGQERCFNAAMLHEFALALGLKHQSGRHDSDCSDLVTVNGLNDAGESVAENLGPYSENSIMNYCSVNETLSEEDILHINRLYKPKHLSHFGQLKHEETGRCLHYRGEKQIAINGGEASLGSFEFKDCQLSMSQLFGQNGWKLESLGEKPNLRRICLAHKGASSIIKAFDCDDIPQPFQRPLIYQADQKMFAGEFEFSRNTFNNNVLIGFDRTIKDEKTLEDISYASLSLFPVAHRDPGPKSKWEFIYPKIDGRLSMFQSYGGVGGEVFDSKHKLDPAAPIAKISIRAGEWVYAIGLKDVYGNEFMLGGQGGELKELSLDPGEYLSEMTQYFAKDQNGVVVKGLHFRTSFGNELYAGDTNLEYRKITFNENTLDALVGFHGRLGIGRISRLGVYTYDIHDSN